MSNPIKTWSADGLTYHELAQQPYTNCVFATGRVEGHPVDTLYLRWERDDGTGNMILLRPDEAAAIAWLMSGALFGYWHDLRDGEDESRDQVDALRGAIEALYQGDPYPATGCGGSFEELLCHEIHGDDADASLDPRTTPTARDLTFKQLAHKWGITMEELGVLSFDHCRNLSTFEEDRQSWEGQGDG